MKFKEIKPGMVIHCPKEGNVRVLLEHLTEMGYEVSDAIKTNAYRTYKEKICFYINPTENVSYGDIDFYAHDEDFRENEGNLIITEFSDLIEPDDYDIDITGGKIRYGGNLSQLNNLIDDSPINSPTDSPVDSPMTAVEVLRWFRYADGDTKLKLFEATTVTDIFCLYTPEQIVQRITDYEATKKAPKPVEVEEGWRIEVYEENGDLWNGDSFWLGYTKEEVESIAKRVAIDCVRQTGKLATWSVIDACKVRED